MPKTTTFIQSAELYDAVYSFKNYAREAERLRAIIDETVPGARTLLDVACGTGEHDRFLRRHYEVDGVDINEDYLRAARMKNPAGNYVRADMTEFDLGRNYDVVACLFSAIAIVKTYERLEHALARMARHVRPGGELIVEPWFTPDGWRAGHVFAHAAHLRGEKVCRVSLRGREGDVSILLFHYLRVTPNAIEHHSERIELGLFTRDEMTWAFEAIGLQPRYHPEGLMGRGLYIAKRIE